MRRHPRCFGAWRHRAAFSRFRADSIALLRHVAGLVREIGLRVVNVDATIVLEAPKVSPHKPAMRARLADAVGLDERRVNVKATTTERLGFTGRGEGMAALATVLLVRMQ